MRKNETPTWLAGVKQETLLKVGNSPLTQGCAQGYRGSLYALMIGFWPFVNSFPDIIHSKYAGSEDRGALILAEMEQDERGHRGLWLQTCKVLGIAETELEHEPLPSIQRLINVIGEDTEPHRSFLRFLGVEIIAEALSVALIGHAPFQEQLGEQGLEWFRVHLNARNEVHATSHEVLTIRLARQYAGRSASEAQLEGEVTQAVDLFIEGGQECHDQLALASR